jgi:hypothetical protein
MAGDHHLEALAFTDGRILAYVSSFTRDALPHRGLGGTVSIYEDEEIVRVAPLQVAGGQAAPCATAGPRRRLRGRSARSTSTQAS